jgi:putative holliday junction resolvase
MRVLSIDFGDKTIGLALKDSSLDLVMPIVAIQRSVSENYFQSIKEVIQSKSIDIIVVGIPLKLDGSDGDQATKTRVFIDQLSTVIDNSIFTVDESFSSVEATSNLVNSGMDSKKLADVIDSAAACVILERFVKESTLLD